MEVDSTSRIARANSAAAKAEREAAERVTTAQKHVEEASREEEKKLDHLRDVYEQRTAVERSRGEDYLEAVRNRNYQAIAEQRRAAEKEQHRIASTAERDLRATERRYADATAGTVRKGETDLKEATDRNFKQQEYERMASNERLDVIKNEFEIQKRQIEADRRDTTATLAKSAQTHRRDLEAKTRAAVEESTAHYEASFEGAMKQHRDAMTDLNWRTSRAADDLRRETATKLDAYASQKKDPFYRMVDIGGKLVEKDDQFVFTAKIPEHEQDRININVRANELIISGKRRSEEAVETGPGRVSRTSSYQSFSENFPLSFPVEPKNMTREFEGDTLVVRIPKRSTYSAPPPKAAPERATLERPKFPKNLPDEKALAKLNDPERGPEPQDDRIPPSKRKKTGKVLA